MSIPIPTEALRRYRESRGLPWFTASFSINAFLVRSERIGEWDDLLIFVWHDERGISRRREWVVTGEASVEQFEAPTHPDGVAYIVCQHAAAAFRLGVHRNRPAFEQVAHLEYVRWDRGHRPTVAELEDPALPRFVGDLSTNVHDRVSDRQPFRPERLDTMGCPVFRARHDHAEALGIAAVQRKRLGTSRISITFVRAVHLQTLCG